MNPAAIRAILAGHDRSLRATVTRTALSLLEPGYRAVIAARNLTFDAGLREPVKLNRPTLSVGNLTTGGSGKTPVVLAIARLLLNLNHRPAILLRGYRSTNQHRSDEATLLSDELGCHVIVEPDPDRVAAAARVLQRKPDVSVFLLDDAFQRRQVHRDLDLVLIDATLPWGFDHLLPRGLLREPVTALRRADAVLITRADAVEPATIQAIDQRMAAITGQPSLGHVSFTWGDLRDQFEQTHTLDSLRHQRVLGFTGLGNPASFWATLERVAQVVHRLEFPDHHPYTQRDLHDVILHAATKHRADAVVMSQKDWVKIKPILSGCKNPVALSLLWPQVQLKWNRGEREFVSRIQQALTIRN